VAGNSHTWRGIFTLGIDMSRQDRPQVYDGEYRGHAASIRNKVG
jgi:hypothetical protein